MSAAVGVAPPVHPAAALQGGAYIHEVLLVVDVMRMDLLAFALVGWRPKVMIKTRPPLAQCLSGIVRL